MPDLPLPIPSEETEPFWAYCRQGELRVQSCGGCGSLRHPPRPMCPRCGSFVFGWKALSGRGRVYSYIVSRQAVHPALQGRVPHAAVLVELEEGIRMTSNLVDCAPDEIEIGIPVEVVFELASDEITLPKFRALRAG